MPIYGYACTCGSTCDVIRTFLDKTPLICVSCKQQMQRQLSAPGFKFKGRITPGGGPDRLTADMIGVPLKDLPAGLRTSKEDLKRIAEQSE